MYLAKSVSALILVLMSSCVLADKPAGALYLDGGDSDTALVLAHGRGKHPGWLVVDPLRKGVHEKLGYHTLSLQMPNRYRDWREYAEAFPQAYDAILKGMRYLQEEKKVSVIYLLGHSMGARMASAFVAENPDQALAGLIVAGCRNNGGIPLSCVQSLEATDLPVLDIWGGRSSKDMQAARARQTLLSATYQQVAIPGANHRFEGHEGELVSAVTDWLNTRRQRGKTLQGTADHAIRGYR